jgi:hypothetical protein
MEVPLVLCMEELEGILVILLGIMFFISMQRCHIFVCCYTYKHMFSKTSYLQCSKDDALFSMQAGREVLVDCDSCRGYILQNWV